MLETFERGLLAALEGVVAELKTLRADPVVGDVIDDLTDAARLDLLGEGPVKSPREAQP